MSNIASSLENVAGTVAIAMENIATKMHPPSPSDSTNTLATLARLIHPGSSAAPAINLTTNSCTTAIQMIEEDEGFSNDDLTSATTCIMSNEGLAKMYVLLKSQGTRSSLIWAHMHKGGL